MTKVPTVSGGTATSHQKCTYDAWNRMVVDEAPDSTTQVPVKKSVMTYDGLGRRIIKTVTGSGDMDHTYHYYYDGQQIGVSGVSP